MITLLFSALLFSVVGVELGSDLNKFPGGWLTVQPQTSHCMGSLQSPGLLSNLNPNYSVSGCAPGTTLNKTYVRGTAWDSTCTAFYSIFYSVSECAPGTTLNKTQGHCMALLTCTALYWPHVVQIPAYNTREVKQFYFKSESCRIIGEWLPLRPLSRPAPR